MGKQKIVLKLPLDDERKRRKAFKAAVGVNGVTSATMEGDKIIVVGEGVDPIALTTMLRRGLGYAELLSVSSGDDKKKGDGYGYGGYGGYGGGGGGMAYGGSKAEGKDKDHGHSGYGGGGGKDKDHGHGGYGGGMAYGGSGGKDKDHGHGGYGSGGGGHAVAPPASSYPAYYNPYSAVPPSYPVYSYYPTAAYPAAQEQDPGCSIM